MLPSVIYARDRLKALLAEAAHLAESEFPYEHSREALRLISNQFEQKIQTLEKFTDQSDAATMKQACAVFLRDLFVYLPLLGFILRSTNVRNAFEVFGPLLSLVRKVLRQDTRLIISSEWDYSPFIYDQIAYLPNFVLIGLPASESSNPLVLPLAGHELGHSVWQTHALGPLFQARLTQAIVDTLASDLAGFAKAFNVSPISKQDLLQSLFVVQMWAPIADWAVRQTEESFCDFIGLAIFGTSYLHAFAYLLCPTTGERSEVYPGMTTRVRNLIKGCGALGMEAPAGYEDLFDADAAPPNASPAKLFRLAVADKALDCVIDATIEKAREIVAACGLAKPNPAEVARILRCFRLAVPAERSTSLADILNAGWLAAQDPDLWKDAPQIERKRESALKELVLKTIEVFHIEHLQP